MNLHEVITQASSTLLRQGSHHLTLLTAFEGLAVPAKSVLHSVPTTTEERQHRLFLLGKQLASQYASRTIERVWLITEAWIVMTPHYQTISVPPSQHPQRKEVLLVLELDLPTLTQRADLRLIHRNKKKKITSLTPLAESSTSEQIFPLGVLLHAFVIGFAQASSGHPQGQALLTSMLQIKQQMDRLLND